MKKPKAKKAAKSCANHPTTIAGLDGPRLAHSVAKLRYDELVLFLRHLCLEFHQDSVGDFARERPNLGEALQTLSNELQPCITAAEDIDAVCKQYYLQDHNE